MTKLTKQQDWVKGLKENFYGMVQQDRMTLAEWNKLKQFITQLLRKERVGAYKKGFNDCLKERGLTGEEYQNLHL